MSETSYFTAICLKLFKMEMRLSIPSSSISSSSFRNCASLAGVLIFCSSLSPVLSSYSKSTRRMVFDPISTKPIRFIKYPLISGLNHIFRFDPLIKLFFSQQAGVNGRFFQCKSFFMRILGDFGCIFIADMRVECCNKHEGVFQEPSDILLDRLDADCTLVFECLHAVSKQVDRLERIIEDHRFEHIQFKIAL